MQIFLSSLWNLPSLLNLSVYQLPLRNLIRPIAPIFSYDIEAGGDGLRTSNASQLKLWRQEKCAPLCSVRIPFGGLEGMRTSLLASM